MTPSEALPVIVVGTDPLCGWCFGIVDALGEARRQLACEFRFEAACGGLVTGDRVHPIAEDEGYLRQGLAVVARTTGRQATPAYFDDIIAKGTWVSNSEPSVRAVVLARERFGDDTALDLSSALSDALYIEGREPDSAGTLSDLVERLGQHGASFAAAWDGDAARQATRLEMARARSIGITTYPSLVLRSGRGLVPLMAGYASADDIVFTVRAAVRKVAA